MLFRSGPDGTLYVGDSEKGRIWRIVYTGERRIAAAGVAAANLPPPKEKPLSPVAEKNFAAYKMYCGICHMEDGRGVSGLQPSLRESAVAAGDITQLIRVVLKGPAAVLPADRPKFANAMPAFDVLPDDAIAAALTHVRENFNNPSGSAVTAEQIKAARQ